MKQRTDNKIRNYSAVLDAKYGKPGTPEREKFEQEADAFFSGQIIRDARKEANLTQEELATRIGCDKGYISRIENGKTIPTAASFFRIVAAMGMQIQIVRAPAIAV